MGQGGYGGVMLWWLAIATALAGGFYLESPHVGTREEAARIEQTASEGGHGARIVRRFIDGAGWRYIVRVEGLESRAEAEQVASSLAESLGVGIDILQVDGARARFVERLDPGGREAPEAESAPELSKLARAVLERAAAAHGTDRETLTRWMTGPTHFEYRRTLGDGTVVDHRWWTRDGATYVEVRGVEGDCASSRVFVEHGRAWLAVGDGGWQPQAGERAAVVVADLGPPAVIPIVLGLRRAMDERPELLQMQYEGESEVSGEPVHVLGYGGTPGTPALVLEISKQDALVRRVSFGGGELVHELSDYRETSHSMLPYRIVSTRAGGAIDVVEVAVLRTGEDAVDDAFVLPRNPTSPPP